MGSAHHAAWSLGVRPAQRYNFRRLVLNRRSAALAADAALLGAPAGPTLRATRLLVAATADGGRRTRRPRLHTKDWPLAT
jgi:hypothetical protein